MPVTIQHARPDTSLECSASIIAQGFPQPIPAEVRARACILPGAGGGQKRDIDLQIIGDDYSRSAEISLDNERYLKELIRLGSDGKQTVSTRAGKIQFFIVRGGAEGFLPADMAKKNASKLPGTRVIGRRATAVSLRPQ